MDVRFSLIHASPVSTGGLHWWGPLDSMKQIRFLYSGLDGARWRNWSPTARSTLVRIDIYAWCWVKTPSSNSLHIAELQGKFEPLAKGGDRRPLDRGCREDREHIRLRTRVHNCETNMQGRWPPLGYLQYVERMLS